MKNFKAISLLNSKYIYIQNCSIIPFMKIIIANNTIKKSPPLIYSHIKQ